MNYALCAVPVCAVRSNPGHEQELGSQLLFGEAVEIRSVENDWAGICCLQDGYEGWCMLNQLVAVNEAIIGEKNVPLFQNWQNEIVVNNIPMHVPLGACLPGFQNGKAVWGNLEINANPSVLSAAVLPFNEANIQSIASSCLNTAYLWGGRSVFGIDCSGLVQLVFRFFGKGLPRNAAEQALQGADVGFLQEARCGDLAFFDDEKGKIIHVGLLLSNHEILHAAGKVRIDTIDNAGILNRDTFQRTHQLRLVKRV